MINRIEVERTFVVNNCNTSWSDKQNLTTKKSKYYCGKQAVKIEYYGVNSALSFTSLVRVIKDLRNSQITFTLVR